MKVKFIVEESVKVQGGGDVQLNVTPRPGRFTPGKDTRYPLYRRLCEPQGRFGRVRNTSPPQGLDPRTVQPEVSCYTDSVNRLFVIFDFLMLVTVKITE